MKLNASPCLVVLAKTPVLGQVKTRLAATIGDRAALDVYQQLLVKTAAVCERWDGPVEIHYSGDDITRWPLQPFAHIPQVNGHLGLRIEAALQSGISKYGAAVCIGSDCPGLSINALTSVCAPLSHNAVAFGPAEDGGYWSVASTDSKAVACLCAEDLPWSQPELLTESRHRLHAAGHSVILGNRLYDCDTKQDLDRAQAEGLLPE